MTFMTTNVGRLASNTTSALFWPSSPMPPDDVWLIVYKFISGPMDDLIVGSDIGEQHILHEAGFWWEITNGGQIGFEFRGVFDGFTKSSINVVWRRSAATGLTRICMCLKKNTMSQVS
jgi:hypothetical protein